MLSTRPLKSITGSARRHLTHERLAIRHFTTHSTPQYPPPFINPPFSPPPPPPPHPRPPPSPSSRSSRLYLVGGTFLAGLAIGYWYWRDNNGGFPHSCMTKVQIARKLLNEAESIDPSLSPSAASQRDRLLQQADTHLRAALKSINIKDPVTPSPTSLLPTLSFYIDPALPPHIFHLLGQSSLLQGPTHYRPAEAYLLASLRGLVEESAREEERGKKESGLGGEEAKEYFDGQVLGVGRQLGWLYYLMENDIAAEAVLYRCLQLVSELREKQQSRDKNRVVMKEKEGDGSGRAGLIDVTEFNDDVTAEISEQLSAVYRKRGDYNRAVEWTANALRMNDKAEKTSSPPSTDDARLQRQLRSLHLYTALASDHFALHVAPVTKPVPFRSVNTPSPLDHAYHASIHALEQLDQVINSFSQRSSSVSSKPKSKAKPQSSPSFPSKPSSPPIRGAAPLNVLPSMSHVEWLSSPRINSVFQLPPSADRSALLTEVVACYSNLASVLSAGGAGEDADKAWGIAERAAKLTGDGGYLDIIAEQKAMLRSSEAEP